MVPEQIGGKKKGFERLLSSLGFSSEIWLPFVDAYRTICIAPSSEARAEFEAIRELGSAA